MPTPRFYDVGAVTLYNLQTGRSPVEVGYGGRARGLEPPANIDAGVGFTAVVARAVGRCRFGIPLEDLQLLCIALNHEPVDRVRALGAANLTSVLYYCRHDESFLDSKTIHRAVRCLWLDQG